MEQYDKYSGCWRNVSRPSAQLDGLKLSFGADGSVTSDNICKGYANVGIIQNLGNSISSINSIPATYDVGLNIVSILTAQDPE